MYIMLVKIYFPEYKEAFAKNILAISGIGENILSGILAEMGDISRFDDVKEIQKLSGLGLVACSSGKHTGETKISHRERKRLRYWLFQAAKSAVAHSEEFKELHVYYTTRKENPLKKMQLLIVIACKILRVILKIVLQFQTLAGIPASHTFGMPGGKVTQEQAEIIQQVSWNVYNNWEKTE